MPPSNQGPPPRGLRALPRVEERIRCGCRWSLSEEPGHHKLPEQCQKTKLDKEQDTFGGDGYVHYLDCSSNCTL